MIEAARLGLWLGVASCGASALLSWRGRRTPALSMLGVGALAFWAAVAVLARALVRSDLSVTYVVDHSRETSSAPYRLAGLWGGMAGSLLLWTALLAAIVLVALARRPIGRVGHGIGALLVGATGLTVALAADPFNRLQIPAIRGRGLTPILEHPAMLIHPPILYTGLLLTAVPMLVVVDVVARGDTALPMTDLRRMVRNAALWIGVGLVLGASWAYAELGWGGYWAWDPVENAALMPWLALLAWLHAARAPWATPRFLSALAVVPLLLVFLGAWITRAGLTDSVHAFAQARGVGLGFAALVVALAVITVTAVLRVPGPFRQGGAGPTVGPVALAGFLLLAVALGTGYPVVRDLLADERVTVGGSYYSRAAWPLAVAATGLLAALLVRRARRLAAVGAVLGGAAALTVGLPWFGALLLASGAGAAVVAAAGVATDRRRRWIHLAHLGFAIMLVGVAGTTGTERDRFALAPGESDRFRGEVVELRGLEVVDLGAGRTSVRADLVVDGASLRPARVAHAAVGVVLPETDTDNRWNGDLQSVLRDATDGLAVIELRYRPLAGFIWYGAAIMLTGLAAARRHHVSPSGAGRGSTEVAPAWSGSSAGTSAAGSGAPGASGTD